VPVCVIAPLDDVIERLRPTVDAANAVAKLFVNATSFVPELESVIGPENAFALPNVIACAPALKLDAPEIVNAPVCVIAPAAVTTKPPPIEVLIVLFRATAPAAVNVNVWPLDHVRGSTKVILPVPAPLALVVVTLTLLLAKAVSKLPVVNNESFTAPEAAQVVAEEVHEVSALLSVPDIPAVVALL